MTMNIVLFGRVTWLPSVQDFGAIVKADGREKEDG